MFHWIVFLRVKLINNIGSDNCVAPTKQQAIFWTNDGTFYGRIYASFGLNEFKNSLELFRWQAWPWNTIAMDPSMRSIGQTSRQVQQLAWSSTGKEAHRVSVLVRRLTDSLVLKRCSQNRKERCVAKFEWSALDSIINWNSNHWTTSYHQITWSIETTMFVA